MAEGGGGDDEGNPFSFNIFVKSNHNASDDDSDEENGQPISYMNPNLPDISSTAQRCDQRMGKEDECPIRQRKEEKDDNPFSFKKFLQTGGQKRGHAAGSSLATFDLANDLPDFVQDHLQAENLGEFERCQSPLHLVTEAPGPLPDFALDSANGAAGCPDSPTFSSSSQDSQNNDDNQLLDGQMIVPVLDLGDGDRVNNDILENQHASNNNNDVLGKASSASSGEDFQCIDIAEDVPSRVVGLNDFHHIGSTGGLPDFLSDNAINSLCSVRPKVNLDVQNGFDSVEVHANDDSGRELARLKEENNQLRQQLEEALSNGEHQTRRVQEVEGKMKVIKKGEAEETQALENMIQQVEANLLTTTQRAVNAESQVTKLSQEVVSLQTQVASLQSDLNLLKGGHSPTEPVREKARHVSRQLSAAARSADQSLKQLMSGVETLQLLSGVLASIDTVTETETESSSSHSPEGASGS